MKDAFVAIHGHFYQPPRENPWLDVIEKEESAHPFHDWNERIASECYRPNAHARIVDGQGKILKIFNNYSSMSFNFGPTLLRWFEKRYPRTYQRILDADRESLKRWGHGNAIGQVYNHIIMPLANTRDRETEVVWGIADFEKRFGRKPEALWLPETAVNGPTLEVLVRHGMRFLILSPYQALRTRPLGGAKWSDASQGKIDPTQPYRCFLKDRSGKKKKDQGIALFFYDGPVSKEVSFGDLLRDGNVFCDRLMKAYQPSRNRPQLIHLATDGETYGHHKKFGDMALAYALQKGLSLAGLELINYGAFLDRFPPTCEAEIDEGPKGEGTSWSCSHGVDRWKEDCGCQTGGEPGWNQKWRAPLREALNGLRDRLASVFEREGGAIFHNPWEARNGYIQVVLHRGPETLRRYWETFGRPGLSEAQRAKGMKLLEMQRYALQMFTSCGWFFNDLAGIETILILQYASRALELGKEWVSPEMERAFQDTLFRAESNVSKEGNGQQIYSRLARSKSRLLERIVHHFIVSVLLEPEITEGSLFSYRLEKRRFEKITTGDAWLAFGEVRLKSPVLPEGRTYRFASTPHPEEIFQTWILGEGDRISFEVLKGSLAEQFAGDREGLIRNLGSAGAARFTIRDTFPEERHTLIEKTIEREMERHRGCLAAGYGRTREVLDLLTRLDMEVPHVFRVAAEEALNEDLLREIQRLKDDFKATLDDGKIEKTLQEAKRYGLGLRKEAPSSFLSELLNEKLTLLRDGMEYATPMTMEGRHERVGEALVLLDKAGQWGFELRKGEAQNIMQEILNRSLMEMERSWWEIGNATGGRFASSLLDLAGKLNFNLEILSKIRT